MAQQPFISVFLLVQCISVVFSDDYGTTVANYQYEDYAFDQFMNTTEPIWVVNTTRRESPLCIKDVNSNMTTNNETFFTRSYKNNSQYTEKQLKGKFGYHDQAAAKLFDKMTVYEVNDSKEIDEEILEYLSDSMNCAVVTVLDHSNIELGTQVWRDLRVKDTYVTNTTSPDYKNCSERFNEIVKLTKKNWTSPYSPECKNATGETGKTT
uniref:Salivary lipocalin n=1 Tax=Rhipicephalus sanguineus TaxID=34632 RepID=C9W1K8_RHISA